MAETIQTEVIPVQDFIFKGLMQRFHEVFGIKAVFGNSTDEIQAVKKMQQGGVDYPFLFLSVSSFARTVDAWRATPFIRRGVDAVVKTDNKQSLRVSMVPVDYICEVTYKDNNFAGVKQFAKRWLMSIQSGWLKFAIEYGQIHLPIHIVLGDEVQIPKREANAENIQEYTVLTSLTVKGWGGEKKLRDQEAVVEINLDAYFEELKQQGAQVFEFPTEEQ